MRCTSWLRALAVAGLLALAVTAVPAAGTKKDPPGTAPIMAQLRATFAAWDLNSDGYLDKEELAKAFRGADAKPYDYKAASKTDKTDTVTSKSSSKPDYSQYPDYEFLVALDTDKDEKISKDEFETWARDYAVQLKQQLDTLQRIAAAEQKLAALQNTASKKEIHAIESELKKEQQAYKKMTTQAKKFEKQLQKAMKQHAKK
jgi:hypothetical protein